MVKPFITNENNHRWDLAIQKIANGFASILWKKKFKKSAIQENDDKIVSVVE